MPDEEKPAERPAPSAAAAAASRARRIGGRVSSTPPPPAPGPAVAAGKPTSLIKRAKPPTDADAGRPVDDDGGHSAPAPAVVTAVPAWLAWLPAAVLTAGVITMVVLLTVFSHGVWWARPSANAIREEVLAAAKTCVARTNTYKYTALDKYTAAAHQCTTGKLTTDLDRTIRTVIKKYAPTLKSTQTAQISRGAIEAVSRNGNQWTLLVYGQLTVVNTNDPKGRTDPFAAQVRMEKVHGKWLMSGLQTIASPVS